MVRQDFLTSSKEPIFNLLSLGQRGVGKTVFLAGSYVQLNSDCQPDSLYSLWFEGQDKCSQENLDGIIKYVAETGKYPPSTLKFSDFYFSLKQNKPSKEVSLCHLHWGDIPGEFCDFDNPEFQKIVLDSHSCCVFLNAERLVHDPDYKKAVGSMVKQVVAIANLISNRSSSYSFALILTQCDRLDASPLSHLQIEKELQFLVAPLEAAKANYRRFYSSIPIVNESGRFKLAPQESASALLWLVSCLGKKGDRSLNPSLEALLTSLKDPTHPARQKQVHLPRNFIWLVLASLGTVGVILVILLSFGIFRPTVVSEREQSNEHLRQQYEALIRKNPNNLQTLIMLNNIYVVSGQYKQSLPLLKKIVELQPKNLEWQLTLARVNDLADRPQDAEQIYRQILEQDPNQFDALLETARLRQVQGDTQTALTFFRRAEKATSSPKLKAQVQDELSKIRNH